MGGDDLLGKSTAVLTEGLDQPDAVTVLVVAVAFLVFIIILHGWALNRVSKFFSEHFALYTEATSRWRVSILTGIITQDCDQMRVIGLQCPESHSPQKTL